MFVETSCLIGKNAIAAHDEITANEFYNVKRQSAFKYDFFKFINVHFFVDHLV